VIAGFWLLVIGFWFLVGSFWLLVGGFWFLGRSGGAAVLSLRGRSPKQSFR
jgi:hypothetical protein